VTFIIVRSGCVVVLAARPGLPTRNYSWSHNLLNRSQTTDWQAAPLLPFAVRRKPDGGRHHRQKRVIMNTLTLHYNACAKLR